MKTESKVTTHTPGPWEVNVGTVQVHVYGQGGKVVSMPRIEYLRDKPVATPEELANARLIAAAPELLATCETLLNLCRDLAADYPALSYADRLEQAEREAEAAIGKARGV